MFTSWVHHVELINGMGKEKKQNINQEFVLIAIGVVVLFGKKRGGSEKNVWGKMGQEKIGGGGERCWWCVWRGEWGYEKRKVKVWGVWFVGG